MSLKTLWIGALAAALIAGPMAAAVHAQPKEMFVPLLVYRTGPFAPSGIPIANGFVDYFTLVNERDGGINGVKLTWEKCETEYNNARGVECYERSKKHAPTGATVIHPLSTGITYSLIEKATADRIPIISMATGALRPPTGAFSRMSSR